MWKRTILLAAVAGMVLALAPAAQAGLVGELGLLDLAADYGFGPGINPGTEAAWAPGDVYHLMYVTSTTRDATSTEIADYNAFVQADADAEGLGASVGVGWFAMVSTVSTTIDEVVVEGVDAMDNVIVTGPVFTIYLSRLIAVDADDLWDWLFPANTITTLAGDHAMVWTGGRTSNWQSLGADGAVDWDWSGWTDWIAAYKVGSPDNLAPMVAVSSPLEVVPEPATLALLGLGGVGLVLSRKRR